MKRDTIIIGAGVVGLMCAYHLHKAGRKVTIIDEGDITNCTSFGNAGLLSAFDKGCLSYPGVITTTMKQMIKGESPVKVHPKLDPKLFTWLFKFAASANEKRFKKTVMLFEKYGEDTLKLYEKDGNSILEIEDNGGGITCHPIDKVFKSFFTYGKNNGTGIGLFMSKLIIENNMNGRLSVSNKKDGACFKIITPLN